MSKKIAIIGLGYTGFTLSRWVCEILKLQDMNLYKYINNKILSNKSFFNNILLVVLAVYIKGIAFFLKGSGNLLPSRTINKLQ